MKPPRFRRLLLVVGSSLFTLVSAEIVFRFAAAHILDPGEFISMGGILNLDDPLLGFSLVPGASRLIAKGGAFVSRDRINSLGLRDVEQSLERRDGFKRILVLGDSFMFGEGVALEDTVPRLLARSMPRVEVFNAGIRAYDLGQEYLYYRDKGSPFREDLLLLALFVNDLGPENDYVMDLGDDGLPVSYHRRPDLVEKDRRNASHGVRGAVSGWLRDHSLLYVLVRKRIDTMFQPERPQPAGSNLTDAPHPPLLRAFHAEPRGDVANDWERAYRLLDLIEKLSRERGSRLALILVPAPWQTSQTEWENWTRVDWVRNFGVEPGSLARRKPQEMFRHWCEKSGTPCLDLQEAFENGAQRGLYFWPQDMHWNEAGNHVAADAVRSFLVERGLP